ncbi:hypothetical protein HID58_009768 [Brassica napus]|uniref:Uncharacterized protein n=1 Tax=Brassica napus TaxID=3708 RepID=A0ABQ8DTH2_BRANA|nr:hypothetical protein HID58_009768 [Brassica napus]
MVKNLIGKFYQRSLVRLLLQRTFSLARQWRRKKVIFVIRAQMLVKERSEAMKKEVSLPRSASESRQQLTVSNYDLNLDESNVDLERRLNHCLR